MFLDTIDTSHLAGIHASLGVVPPSITARTAEVSAPAAHLTIIGGGGDHAPLHAVNDASRTVEALKCHFVRDVSVCGASYVFHGTKLLVDGSHLSDVAAEWVGRPMADSPLASGPLKETFVREPCIIAAGPGHLIYGHWLVDFIPRLMIAKEVLGASFVESRIVLPHDTPHWALSMMQSVAGINKAQCLFFERGVERLAIEQACIPTYGHTDYFFHSFCKSMFGAVGAPLSGSGQRRLCLSRAGFERETHGVRKMFLDRERFEAKAIAEGFEIVQPELMTFLEQVALFRAASHVIGEYGSGLHNTIFSPHGTKTGFIRCPNSIQLRIGALCGQDSVVILPSTDRVGNEGVLEYAMSEQDTNDFFSAMR